jgi:hypothetical protein
MGMATFTEDEIRSEKNFKPENLFDELNQLKARNIINGNE